MTPLRILLVSMPWRDYRTPNPGLGILKAMLLEAGHHCDVLEASLTMAAELGPDRTRAFETGEFIETAFAPHVYDDYSIERAAQALTHGLGHEQREAQIFTPEELRAHGRAPDENDRDQRDTLARRLPVAAGAVLDRLLEEIDWAEHDVVGFSCTFNQTLASAAMARRIRERWPQVRLLVGGAACEGPMAEALMSVFPWYDAAASGRAEGTVVELCERVAAGAGAGSLGGAVFRHGDGLQVVDAAPPRVPLDALPIPDYEHFQPQARALGVAVPKTVPMEASVGCWWGQKNLCTFCGLNATSLEFSQKSPERAIQEIRELARRYGIDRINFTDNILPLSYYDTVIPRLVELAEHGERYTFFVEIKTNATKRQLEQLRDAGVVFLQPGIESLSTPILRLMKKGNTGISQVQYLKWSAELGQDLAYNILVASPGERAEDYEPVIAEIPSVVHLQPPSNRGAVQLQRFSPYFDDPERWGIRDVRPHPLYGDVFPGVADEVLRRLVYHFVFTHEQLHEEGLVTTRHRLHRALARWQTVHRPGLLTYTHGHRWLTIEDGREGAWVGTDAHRTVTLEGLDATLYRALDRVRTIPDIAREAGAAPTLVRTILERLERERLVLRDGPRWLALAIQAPRLASPLRLGQARPPRWDRPAPPDLPWPEACPEAARAAINTACAST